MPHDGEDPILKRIQVLPVEFFVFGHNTSCQGSLSNTLRRSLS